jgi:hypothetical protein
MPEVTEFIRKMPHENSVVNVSGVGCSVYSASVFQIPDINLNASGFYSFMTYSEISMQSLLLLPDCSLCAP